MGLKEEIFRLVSLAIPVILAQLLTAAAGFVDTLMAGRAGVPDLAGVALGSALWLTLVIAPMGLFMAINPVVGQYAGAGNYSAIIKFMHQCIRVAVILMVILIILFHLHHLYLPWIIDDPEVVEVTADYLVGFSWGVPALIGTFLIRPYSEGLAFTRPYLVASIVSLVLNIPANYALIFGHWGAPELGGAGAGWATAIAFWAAFFVMLLYSKKHSVYQQASLWSAWHDFDIAELKHLMHVGLPIAMTLFVEVSIFSLIALFLGGRPSYEIAAHQVAMNVSYLAFTLPLSISVVATIRVSQNIGANNKAAAWLSARAALYLAIIAAAFNISILVIFSDVIARLYSTDSAVVDLAAYLMLFAALFQLFDAFVVPTQGVLRGCKDTRIPLMLAILAYWVVALPLGYLLGLTDRIVPAMGAEGFWVSLVVGLAISGVLMSSRMVLVLRP